MNDLVNSDESQEQVDLKFAEIIAVSTFSRRQEVMRVLSELVFRQAQDSYLMDYNYNIETTLSSENFLKVNEVMLVLELFLSVSESESNAGE